MFEFSRSILGTGEILDVNPAPKKDVALSFKVTRDLDQRLRALAVRWERSKAWTAVRLIERALELEEKRIRKR